MCTTQFTPTSTGQIDINATYVPTSSHLTAIFQRLNVASAVDATLMTLRCPPFAIAIGEPVACNATVTDLYPGRPGVVPNLPVAITAGTGTFSAPGQLSPQTPGSGSCTTTSSGCTLLFRANPVLSEQGVTHSLTATFSGNQDYQLAQGSAVVTVGGPNPHSVSVTVQCNRGSTPSTPLQVNSGSTTRCTATVVDTQPPDGNGNPTQITPTGTISWSAAQQYGAGNFAGSPPITCALTAVDAATARCRVTYTPTSIGLAPAPNYLDTQTISASYGGDFLHTAPASPSSQPVYVTDQHPIQVSVDCLPTPSRSQPLILGGPSAPSTTCTATVADTAMTGLRVAPTDNVQWNVNSVGAGGNGSFTPNPCVLTSINANTSQCQITYQPTAMGNADGPDQVNTHKLTATYQGDGLHPPVNNTGSTNVFVANIHAVTVAIACAPQTTPATPLLIGPPPATTACLVTVTDTASTPVTPTGNVALSVSSNGAGGTGTFNPASPCALQPVDASTARCAPDVYQPTAVGAMDGSGPGTNTHLLTATYAGDGLHPPVNNTGSTNVFVGYHPVNVTIACAPPTSPAAPLLVGPPATTTSCSVTVTDPTATPVAPTGSVTWTIASVGAGGTGTFTPSATCTLQPVSGSVAQCSTSTTYQPTVVGAPDGSGGATAPAMNTHVLTAAYSGDALHPPFSNDQLGNASISVD
jgi:hypothetical protein